MISEEFFVNLYTFFKNIFIVEAVYAAYQFPFFDIKEIHACIKIVISPLRFKFYFGYSQNDDSFAVFQVEETNMAIMCRSLNRTQLYDSSFWCRQI